MTTQQTLDVAEILGTHPGASLGEIARQLSDLAIRCEVSDLHGRVGGAQDFLDNPDNSDEDAFYRNHETMQLASFVPTLMLNLARRLDKLQSQCESQV